MRPKAWEVWYAEVAFEDQSLSKDRPVIVIDPEKLRVLCVPVTSHEARNVYGEHEIIRWKAAGLDHPSTARTGKLIELPESCFRRKIGVLELIDIACIRKMLG